MGGRASVVQTTSLQCNWKRPQKGIRLLIIARGRPRLVALMSIYFGMGDRDGAA
jgi:hypothetical protein